MTHNEEHEKLRSAYLDGELSASESARFDESLTPGQRERLAGEMRFESAMSETLSKGASCPDALWLRTLARREAAPVRVYPLRALGAGCGGHRRGHRHGGGGRRDPLVHHAAVLRNVE